MKILTFVCELRFEGGNQKLVYRQIEFATRLRVWYTALTALCTGCGN